MHDMTFRLQTEKAHFTYPGWHDIPAMKTRMREFGEIKIYSHVHEEGDEDEDKPTPYAHDHVFVWWKKKIDVKNAELKFDIPDLKKVNPTEAGKAFHPNIQTKRDIEWARTICMKYHLGHKTKDSGKKYFKKPIELYQEGVENWKFEEEHFDLAVAAPTLRDACLNLDIKVKTVGDIVTVRKGEKAKRTYGEIEEDCTDKFIPCGIPWDRKKKALIIWGDPGMGKTNWAINQFKKPWVIEDKDDLKMVPQDADGLVFDDYDFHDQDECVQKHLLDAKRPRTIKARNYNAFKPHIPIVMCTNDLYRMCKWDGCSGALKTRAVVWKTEDKPLYESSSS